tara:strand:- start:166 stop:1137 length:972 start_codon:yes stop_codon:yes gene_type:complete
MKDYFIRKIKSKKKDKYSYIYLDKRGNKINKNKYSSILKHLYIPPAYDNVKINLNKGKVLAIGYDEKNRPQYIYNQSFVKKQNKSKFLKMIEFGESYKKIMNAIKRDLQDKDETKNKQIAMALLLVIECGIRVGSEKYRDENNSFGATTLESRHFKINKDKVSVDFIGKKGVRNTGSIRNKKLSQNLRKKRRTLNKNQQVFTYHYGNNDYTLKNTDVNNYLKKFGNFSSKNFRTWIANLGFITELLHHKDIKNITERKKNVEKSLDIICSKLNNTKTVCKKNYVDPYIINIYLNDISKFKKTFKKCTTKEEISEKYIELLKSK